jgi:hypothetical protein
MTLRIFDAARADRCEDLRSGVLAEMDALPIPQASGRRESRGQQRRREKVERTVDEFLASMGGANPPATEDELLTRLTPLTVYVMSWLIRQLVIQVLKACWRRWHAAEGIPSRSEQ